MKLALRWIQSEGTSTIQIPCPTLQGLHQIISSSLRFSLNGRDVLHAPSPQASLHSAGVTSGDLIYCSFDPTAFVSETAVAENQNFGDIQEHSSGKAYRSPDFDITDARWAEQETPVRETEGDFCGMDIDDVSVDFDISAHKLVIAVDAILLDSGLIGLDIVSGTRMDRIRMPHQWPSKNSAMSLWYTLPELYNSSSANSTECIVLKFHCVGDWVNVYGSVAKDDDDDLGFHKLFLNKNKFALDDKMVKDSLALPLSIHLCERTGLNFPASLMGLPTELKLAILESLDAFEIARIGCVCSEMRYLSSDNNELWRRKYSKKFGSDVSKDARAASSWKERFAIQWEVMKKRKSAAAAAATDCLRRAFSGNRRKQRQIVISGY